MRLTLTGLRKNTKHLCLLVCLLLLLTGTLTSVFTASTAQAASSSISYQDLITRVTPQQTKFCSPLKGKTYYTDCMTAYGNGVSASYFASSESAVNKQINQTCTSPPPLIMYPPSQLNSCGAFAQGATNAKSILKSSSQSSSTSGGSSQSSNNPQPANQQNSSDSSQNKPPPISECNKVKNANDQKKCKQAYQDCVQPPYSASHIADCKSKIIDKYKNGGGNNGNNNGNNNANTTPSPTGQGKNCDGKNDCNLIQLYVNPFINLLSIVVGLVVAASLIMGGIQYTASSGDPQKTGAAKSRIQNTLLAFLAYAFMYAFLNFLVPGGIFP
jgi:hypothetical protein